MGRLRGRPRGDGPESGPTPGAPTTYPRPPRPFVELIRPALSSRLPRGQTPAPNGLAGNRRGTRGSAAGARARPTAILGDPEPDLVAVGIRGRSSMPVAPPTSRADAPQGAALESAPDDSGAGGVGTRPSCRNRWAGPCPRRRDVRAATAAPAARGQTPPGAAPGVRPRTRGYACRENSAEAAQGPISPPFGRARMLPCRYRRGSRQPRQVPLRRRVARAGRRPEGSVTTRAVGVARHNVRALELGFPNVIYCPYSNRDLPENTTNREHIIPLSLGGVDGFEIPVDAAVNSYLGKALDAPLASEFLFALRRTKYNARGHSGKEPLATIKKASYGSDNRPAQVSFHSKRGLCVWDARDRKEVTESVGAFCINTSLNIDLPVRFTAKVALAAGYYVYGNLFREHVDHHQLRDVMNTDPAKLALHTAPAAPERLTLRVDSYLHKPPSDEDITLPALRAFCSTVRGSVAVLMPGPDCFGIGVGILGQYLGMIIAPAKTDSFPNAGDYAWGHVVASVDGKLRRWSWVHALTQWTRISPSEEP